MSEKATKQRSGSGMPEALRKIVVSLKRRPQTIPLIVFVIAFCNIVLSVLICLISAKSKVLRTVFGIKSMGAGMKNV